MSYEVRAAIRSMLLPVVSAREIEFLAEVSRSLDAIGVADGKANWINLQLRQWKRSGSPTPVFNNFVRNLLFDPTRDPVTYMFDSVVGPNGSAYSDAARLASVNFFDLQSTLINNHLLPHDAARQILSHVGMIARLAVEEKMTASEISRLITVRDNRFSLNWRAVHAILTKIGTAPVLDLPTASGIYAEDTEAEPELLGDLSIVGSIDRVAEIADSLGCKGEFTVWLNDLFVNDIHAPYLLLLHYQLIIQAKFDHAVTYAYEFKPRGQIADWLTEQYIAAGIPVARNAFLNNAKATLRFDSVWVTGRTDHLRSATALANILETIENLGSLVKDELAAQIRGLLHRYIRVESERNDGVLPLLIPALSHAQAVSLLTAIGAGNSSTTGILEQRLVDCFGLKLHPTAAHWSAKGIGDSVFAANTFRKKLGDIEFELPVRPHPQIIAYESHGGRLSRPYVMDHLDSFAYVLAAREEELQTIAPLADWSFTVVFVAHAFEGNLPAVVVVKGCNVNLRYETFADVANQLSDAQDLVIINSYLISPLNSGFVHPNVRRQAHRFI
ncbi:hypothetical protein SAMN05877838_2051 [Hoeflea halophila]|uniref:Uncharacterized protein n=1 Tax=Hoeflea halophila TaxID=714899 RepID=A0A286IAP3_9HYPH|nr:hypothetical protein [Hoeflea halophila]SOE17160.1 hypothetical protein SAMN05877838_2051 [Hoeflea halophila]